MSNHHSKPQIGVSACLANQPVRFDGGFMKNKFIINECAPFFDIHTVCPEVEMGMGVPRQTIQLRDFDGEIRLVFSKDPNTELTDQMREFSQCRVEKLPALDGYIFKSDSPSCGVYRVPVKNDRTGMRRRNGIGVYAETFKDLYPLVPTEDEGRLNDKGIRENFLERVYAHYRWRCIEHSENPVRSFRDFHRNYKLILMAKDNIASRQLGRLVARVSESNFKEISDEYISVFMQAMSKIPSKGRHVNVMMHILGYLKNNLSRRDKAELLQWFEIYREDRVPRVTPLMLLQHHFSKHQNEYIAEQYYFSPFPDRLMLPV